jgi:hypothetical protein
VWFELRSQLPPNIAATSDRQAFELLTRMVSALRQDSKPPTHSFISQLRGLLASFAMTPIDRQRLGPQLAPADEELAMRFFR